MRTASKGEMQKAHPKGAIGGDKKLSWSREEDEISHTGKRGEVDLTASKKEPKVAEAAFEENRLESCDEREGGENKRLQMNEWG